MAMWDELMSSPEMSQDQTIPVPQYSINKKKRAKLISPKPDDSGGMFLQAGPKPEHERAENVPGQQGVPSIYEAYGMGGKKGILNMLEGGAHDFLRTFIPGAIGGPQASIQALSESEARKEREAKELLEQKQKIIQNPEMVQAYEQAKGMFPQGGTGFNEALQKNLAYQSQMKAAHDIYGSGFTGIMANPYIPEDVKKRVMSSEMAVRSIAPPPSISYQLGDPSLLQEAKSFLTGKPIPVKQNITTHGGYVPPPSIAGSFSSNKPSKTRFNPKTGRIE